MKINVRDEAFFSNIYAWDYGNSLHAGSYKSKAQYYDEAKICYKTYTHVFFKKHKNCQQNIAQITQTH